MEICRSVADIRAAVRRYRDAKEGVGLVTTMGALHAGHRALAVEAKGGHDRIVATIFVNPTQFGNPGDLDAYPRTEAADLDLLERAGTDAVFLPRVEEIYPDGDETVVETTRLSGLYHGAVRPGHFRGVATVVAKLFNIVQPDAAYFGEKDYQQLAVIRRMVLDLHMPLAIRGVATVREADGLALSSRNVRLSPADRAAAPVLHRALLAAEARAEEGATVAELSQVVRETIEAEPRARFRAVDIVNPHDFLAAMGRASGPLGIMVSAEFGPTDNPVLLIDQKEIDA